MRSLLVLKIFILSYCFADAQNFQWARQIGGSSDDEPFAMVIDGSGNTYTTGVFGSVVDFDPGPAVFNLNYLAGYMFILKLDAAGKFVWARQFGGTQGRPLAITLDGSGSIYTTGYFSGSVDFDPGSGVFNLTDVAGTTDIFIQKLDVNGSFIWAKSMGSPLPDEATSIAVDFAGNVYTTGGFNGTADFDPGVGVFNLTAPSYANVFFSKLDASGNFVWAKNIGGTYNAKGQAITTDPSGNVYATGWFGGTVDFDPGPATFELSVTGSIITFDAFVIKLSATGNFVWATNFGNSGNDIGYSLATDLAGNVYTTGTFQGTVDFNPGAAVSNLTTIGATNIFISKLDATGNFIWANRMGSPNSIANSLRLDTSGNIYTTGNFSGTGDFDPGPGVANLIGDATNHADIFISKLDAAGNYIWAKSVGSPDDDIGQAIGIDLAGNVYTAGYFRGLADFDPGVGVYSLSGFFYDIFVLKLGATAGTSINITTQPVAGPVCSGSATTLITAATGTTNIAYQWQFSSALTGIYNNISTGAGYSNTSTPTLGVNTTGNFGAGFYRCMVTGDLATAVFTNSVQLTITDVPLAPTTAGGNACNGTSATLSAFGAANGQYKWYVVATGGAAIVGAFNGTYVTPAITATSTYFVSITVGCESVRTPVIATLITSGCTNLPPVITALPLTTQLEGKIVVNLLPLISSTGTLNFNSLRVVNPPSSGAIASISSGILTIDYSGRLFSGTESITIEACNVTGPCSQKEFTITVAGDIVVYNAVSSNGDGKNDFFFLQYIDILPSTATNQVTIFNRWGDEVFSISDYNNATRSFSGLSNSGSKLPAGIYFYKIFLPKSNKTLNGFLDLK